jgi:RNA polymerase sigma-70 factor (ECF subfamily)
MEKNSPKVQQEAGDQEILDRYFAGDEEAVADLADRYAPRLYTFGLRMCGDRSDAEDLVQDTFLNVLRYLKSFRGETKLKNWLYRVASSVCIKKRRGKNRPDRELSIEDLHPSHDADAPAVDIPDWSDSPSDNVMNDELRAELKKAVALLPHKYRLVFNLRDLEEFSTEETAELLDITPQAVKTRLHRARAYLRKELAEYYRGRRAAVEVEL